jgi:hypothetical protein
MQSELKDQLMQAIPELTEQDFGFYATDLHVIAHPKVIKWLKENYRFFNQITYFTGSEGSDWAGKPCLDIPFAGNWPAN